jgi:hypothetical protein
MPSEGDGGPPCRLRCDEAKLSRLAWVGRNRRAAGRQACVPQINQTPDLGLAIGRLLATFDAKAQLVCARTRARAFKCARSKMANLPARARTRPYVPTGNDLV